MKKFIAISILAGLLLPVSVFGAITYERTPAGFEISNPISFEVSFDDWGETYCEYAGNNYWGIVAIKDISLGPYEPNNFNYSNWVASTTKSAVFVLNLPIAEYRQVYTACSADGITSLNEPSILEAGEPYGDVIFIVLTGEEPPPPGIFTITPEHTTGILAYIGELFSGSGIFPLVALITGLFFGFVVIRKVIDLKNEKEKKRKAEKIEVRLRTKKDDWL